MRKINAAFDPKDRIICTSAYGGHSFYYQPAGSGKPVCLFSIDKHSSSIYHYFRDKGIGNNRDGYSLTIAQLYDFDHYYNERLSLLMNRIPGMIAYIIKEQYDNPQPARRKVNAFRRQERRHNWYDEYLQEEYAA